MRSLAAFTVVLVIGVVALGAAWYWQSMRSRSKLVAQARTLVKEGKHDLAISFVNRFLADSPQNLEALNLKGEILAGSARSSEHLDEVISLSESILRLNANPTGKEAVEQTDETKRRLVEAYLNKGVRVAAQDRQFGTAEGIAKELSARTGTPADIRLHARTLEALGLSGNRNRLAEAAAEYDKATKLDPLDIAGAEQAARLYYFAIKDSAKANAILDNLIRNNLTAPSLLAASRVRSDMAADLASAVKYDEATETRKLADANIKQAVELAPKDLAVRLAAADIALAMRRPAEAAAHLAEVPEESRKNFRYRTLRGIVDLFDNKTADAIESWKSGLIATEGSNAELSWRLAYVLLQLGRVEEAEPLIAQFRRNSGGEETPPAANYLEALKLLKLNKPVDAVAELEKGRLKVLPTLKAQYYYTLGQAREATRDEVGAMEAYSVAIEADPKIASPRLARARLLQTRRPDEAYEEIRRGLAEAGEDPAMLATLARLELQKQSRLPANRRDWTVLESVLDRGKKVAPALAALAIIRAEAMALMGKTAEASDLLKTATAIDKTDPELLVAYAEKLTALGKLEDALVVLDQAADPKLVGDQAKVRILRAKILTQQGHGREARDGLIRDQERIRPDQRPLLWMTLGELYAAQGDLPSARKAYTEWAKLLPDDPLPRLFVLELSLNDTSAEAEATAQESLHVLTDRIGGLYGQVGQATYDLRDRTGGKETPQERATRLDRAETLIARIENDNPLLRYGPLLRGLLSEQRGEQDKAAVAYEKALESEGGLSVLPRLIQLYGTMKGRDNDLKRLREKYAAVAPGIARATAEIYARQGDKERAEELARQVVEGNADSLDARVWQARVLNSLGKPEEAETALRSLVEKNPDSLGPRLALMYFQVSRKETDKAIATIESMIKELKTVERPEVVWGQCWRAVGQMPRADSAFKVALERWPDDPRVTRAVTEYYAATNRTDLAKTILQDVLKRDATQRWASRTLALMLSGRAGDSAGWRAAWEIVKDPAPGGDLPEDRFVRALVLARASDAAKRTEAVQLLKDLVKDLPSDLPASKTSRNILAKLLLKTDPAEAASLASTDAQAANAGLPAIALYAEALVGAKKLEDADRQILRLATIAPDDPATFILSMRLAKARGKSAEAAETLEKTAAAKIDGPEGERAGRLIVQTLLVELEQPASAERVAKMLLAKHPQTSGVLASVVGRQGRRDEALKLYMEAIKKGDAVHIGEAARQSLMMITQDKFDPATIELAETVIDAARQKDPKSSDLLAMAGFLRHYQSRYADEIEIYKEALTGGTSDLPILNNLAWTLSEGLNKPEEALAQINDAIAKSMIVPPEFYDTRGVILTRMGKYDEAIKDLELAVLDKRSGLVWAHLARAYKKAGKLDKFAEAREKAKTGTPPLVPDAIEATERAELVSLIFGQLQ